MGSIQRTARTALQGFQKQKKTTKKMLGVEQGRIPFSFSRKRPMLGPKQANLPLAIQKRQRINKMVRKLKAKRASRLQVRRW
jgi:hypothetical protein